MYTPLQYAQMGAKTIMRKFTPDTLPPSSRFHYHQGVFLSGAEKTAELTRDEEIFDYIKAWVDFNIDCDGNLLRCFKTEFDDIQPALLLFRLYEKTKDERYKKVMDTLFDCIEKWPTNAKGGVWHKYQNQNQMWLDTMYMFGVFAAKYAAVFDKPYMFDKIYHQARLMYDNMINPETGLLYHMWDDSKECPAVNKENGLVEQSWGRAMGWYVAALPEIIELMPDGGKKQDLMRIENLLLNALKNYRDKDTGMWYQLLDKCDNPKNRLETSCTCLFVYGALKALSLGIIDESFKSMIIGGYNGALAKTKTDGGELIVSDICIGTGVGDDEYYFSRPFTNNDLHGMGAFLLMCAEMEKSGLLEDINA